MGKGEDGEEGAEGRYMLKERRGVGVVLASARMWQLRGGCYVGDLCSTARGEARGTNTVGKGARVSQYALRGQRDTVLGLTNPGHA